MSDNFFKTEESFRLIIMKTNEKFLEHINMNKDKNILKYEGKRILCNHYYWVYEYFKCINLLIGNAIEDRSS